MTKLWPDGGPGMPDDVPSPRGGGALKNGRALRHADGTEPPQENFGWLNGTPAAKTDPQGTAYSKIDLRAGGPKKFTTGDQRNRKPKAR